MTYSILSLDSGTLLETYASRGSAYAAARRMIEAEPKARASVAVVEFDDDGMPVGSIEGPDLMRDARPSTHSVGRISAVSHAVYSRVFDRHQR